ncbi:hypothetical protein ACHWQZ_G009380 [Mnemiopsis leidyi]
MNMRLLIVTAAIVYTANCAIKCVQGTNGTAEATACATASETKCSGPKFVEYTGLSTGVNYACGACAGETAGVTCQECTGTDSTTGCNKAVETGADFKCYNWSYNSTSKAFQMSNTTTTCKRLKATALVCNMPNGTATTANYKRTSGCGNCTAADTHCEACTKDSCNKSSALRLAVVFVPLLALLVHLF